MQLGSVSLAGCLEVKFFECLYKILLELTVEVVGKIFGREVFLCIWRVLY